MYMAHVCFYVCCSDCVGVCGNVCCVAAVVKNSGFLNLGVLKYVVCLCRGYDGCCVFCLYCEAWSCRCSCMGSVSVSSCRCCMFLSCVHPGVVLNAVFCMTCSLLMLVEDVRARRPYGRGILQSRSHDYLIGSHECLLLFTQSCCCECFYKWGPIYQQQVIMYVTTPFVNPLFICCTLNSVCLHSFPTYRIAQ